MTNLNSAAALANIRAIDERYPGSMKLAAIVAFLSQINSAPQTAFDPNPLYPVVKAIDDELPGSMKLAAVIYLLAQMSNGPLVIESGIATLSGGTATVLTSNASPANTVLLSYYSKNGASASLSYGTVVTGVSFVINSSDSQDANSVSWAILNP